MDKQTRQQSVVRETKAQDAVQIMMINLMMVKIYVMIIMMIMMPLFITKLYTFTPIEL